ncbi:UNVERIFIED_ORG: hypothetical protein GGI66_006175 [Rhizobium esperanzae]
MVDDRLNGMLSLVGKTRLLRYLKMAILENEPGQMEGMPPRV